MAWVKQQSIPVLLANSNPLNHHTDSKHTSQYRSHRQSPTNMASRRPVIKALLIDLSGTVHVDTQPITKSPHAIQRLRASSMPFRFCSNTSKESTAEVREKLAKMGIETRDNEVWTSIGAVNSLLRAKRLARYVASGASVAWGQI